VQQKTFKKLIFCLFLILSFSICNIYKSFNNLKSHEYLFKLNYDINTLIIGDSHPMSSLDPNIIKYSKNIALDSENYFFTYYKLRYFLMHNLQIKNVIIGFAPQNISKINAEMFLYQEPTEKQSYKRYYNLLDYNGKNKIKSFRKNFIEAVLKYEFGIPIKIYKENLFLKYLFRKNINKHDFEFIGNFYSSEISNVNIEDIKNKVKEYFYDDHMKYPGKSDLNIEYLYKIINICSSRGIKIYLYRSPVHPIYYQLLPNETLRDYEDIKNEILNIDKNIEFIDYSKMQLETEHFGDGDHLNVFGAKIVSQLINYKINKDIMNDSI